MYCQTAKTVLRAAKTGVAKKATPSRATSPIPACVRGCVPNIPLDDLNDAVKHSLLCACDMFKGERIDAHMLAVESLVHLTKACHSKSFCANFILSSELLECLLSLILSSRLNRKSAPANHEVSDVEKEHLAMMHRHALTVLANCLSALDESMELSSVISKMPELVSDNLLKTLVVVVAGAASQPHQAVDACRCLQKLCQRSEFAKSEVANMGAFMYLEHAQNCRHAMLQEASVKLMCELK